VKEANEISYHLTVKSSTENLAIVRDFIRKAADETGVNTEVVHKIILAVDEASSNIMRHAYKNNPEGEISYSFIVSGSECTVIITDQGVGFNPAAVRKPDLPVYIKEGKRGGLGMHLMKILMDNVQYESTESGFNKLVLTKKIA